MAVDERSRHDLYTRLTELLGDEHAGTLMAHLTPVGWADVATKQDLVVLKQDLGSFEHRLALRFEGLEERLGGLEERVDLRLQAVEERMIAALHVEVATVYKQMATQSRTFTITVVLALIGAVATNAGLAFAAARLV